MTEYTCPILGCGGILTINLAKNEMQWDDMARCSKCKRSLTVAQMCGMEPVRDEEEKNEM